MTGALTASLLPPSEAVQPCPSPSAKGTTQRNLTAPFEAQLEVSWEEFGGGGGGVGSSHTHDQNLDIQHKLTGLHGGR